MTAPHEDVIVITGLGGMGLAIARRLGSGRQLVLADHAQDLLDRGTDTLRGDVWEGQEALKYSCARPWQPTGSGCWREHGVSRLGRITGKERPPG